MAVPIEVRPVMNLPALGVSASAIGFRGVNMQSDKAICVRDSDQGQVMVIDTASGRVSSKWPLKDVDSAILDPECKILAVRSGTTLQMVSLELQRKLKTSTLPDGEVPSFWTWLTPVTIGIVTANAAYHWSSEGDGAPQEVFRLNARLVGSTIISYSMSADKKWLMATGIKSATDGSVEGTMQLYSVDRRDSQVLASHAGCFTTIKPVGRDDTAIMCCFVESKANERPKLSIIEVGESTAPIRHRGLELPVPNEPAAVGDFPVAVRASKKHDFLYILSKMGYLYLYDIHTGQVLHRQRIVDRPVFAACTHDATSGLLAITAGTGQVLLVTIVVANLVPYILNTLRNPQLGMSVAARLGLPGADELYVAELNRLLSTGDVDGAARLAATSPGGFLRSTDTIRRFQSLPSAGGPPPLLRYFSVLMEKGALNKIESVELANLAMQQGRPELLSKWLHDDKLTCSEHLGDLLSSIDPAVALDVYQRSGEAHEKVITLLLGTGQFARIVPYVQEKGFHPNWQVLLQNIVSKDANAAKDIAIALVKANMAEIGMIIDVFMQFRRLYEVTQFLLEVLQDTAEHGEYQTKLFELSLVQGAPPTMIDSILAMDKFHHFDKPRIAGLCERTGRLQHALSLFTETDDIKRVLRQSAQIDPKFLVAYFGRLSAEVALDCLRELLKSGTQPNLQIVVEAARQYSVQLTPDALIALFEEFKSWEGIYFYLGSVVNTSDSPLVHLKYIMAAAKLQQFKEVERVCRDSTVYDPAAVKDFLLDAKLSDPRALIHVGDRFNFMDEVTSFLWKNGHKSFIVVYVQKVRPAATPIVVGKLLDLDADDEFVVNLLNAVRGLVPVDPLVEAVEQRNRLRLLRPWLEQLVREGNTDPATHNALGKIYITLNKEPQQFLTTNPYYDSAVVGRFCEKLDPYLAVLAYKRGGLSNELIDVTNRNSLFKDQARYLVEKQDPELWKVVLAESNPHRRAVIDEVVTTACPETDNSDAVAAAVKAFMKAELPGELINLLEKLVLQGGKFADNSRLQDLLLATAIRCTVETHDSTRVMEYINRLEHYDGQAIAKVALRDEYRLYEEAFAIYKKFNDHASAVDVLINQLHNLERASQYAARVNLPETWGKLARALLADGQIKEAVDAYIKAEDASDYPRVVEVARNAGRFEDVARYLEMCRQRVKERLIDTELIYAYAQTKRLQDLEMFINSPNVADIQTVGDRCYDEQLYEAAKLLYNAISNNARLASCLVHLKQYREAVDAARKANSIRTWKDVNAACVEAGEFRLAQICGLYIIINPDHLDELVAHYERHGHYEELIKLLEQGIGQESAHKGIFTELGVMYAKYKPEKLMDHIKIFWSRVNVERLLRACEASLLWEEAAYLHIESKEFDAAVRVMIAHSAVAFVHEKFLEVIQKVRNQELHYQAIQFYLDEEPMRLVSLLQTLVGKLDHARVVHQVRKADQLPLIMPYLKSVQGDNISAVNEALNELYVEDEDYEGLRASVKDHDNFDQIALAQRVEKHELLEFRRIAAVLYKNNKRWEQSINLSKADKMYKDAIATAFESQNRELAEALLDFFIAANDKECFTATLYTCYTLIRPDVALELAWRNRIMDYAMPYLVQYIRDVHDKLAVLDERTKPAPEEKAEESAPEAAAYGAGLAPPGGFLQIAAMPYNAAPTGYDYNAGGMAPQMHSGMGMPGMGMGMGVDPNAGFGGYGSHMGGGGW